MSQEQITLFVAGIGLAGTALGAIIGFFSIFLVQILQEKREKKRKSEKSLRIESTSLKHIYTSL